MYQDNVGYVDASIKQDAERLAETAAKSPDATKETPWEMIADGIRWFLILSGLGLGAGLSMYGCSYLSK